MVKASRPEASNSSRSGSTTNQQTSLFTAAEQRSFSPPGPVRSPVVDLGIDALVQWKADIHHYQQQVCQADEEYQGSLFETAANHVDATCIDPFSLELQNFFFFQLPGDRYPSESCIYFVIDTQVPLLLYVGETCKANQRWKGVHDCKRYVLNYQAAHFKHHIPTAINTGFWWDTPVDVRFRQQLESALISRWKSPFNKENWRFWNTPFVHSSFN
ncbi:MAG: GIY-YIG nuclease family protein [Cyanobacteria bacterium J06626_14]